MLSALGLAVAAYLSLYPAMLLCPLLLLVYRVSSHYSCLLCAHSSTVVVLSATQRVWLCGVHCGGHIVDSPPLHCILPHHWIMGLLVCHTWSHVSSSQMEALLKEVTLPCVIVILHLHHFLFQHDSARPDSQCGPLLVLLHRGLRTLPCFLPVCVSNQCFHLCTTPHNQIQV